MLSAFLCLTNFKLFVNGIDKIGLQDVKYGWFTNCRIMEAIL